MSKADNLAKLGDATGAVMQVVNYKTGAVATGSGVIPYDDTIPQNSEGTEYMTLAITPKSVSNKLKIDVVLVCNSPTVGGATVMVALFQDSTANALAIVPEYIATNDAFAVVKFTHYMDAGTTSATTFKVRAGFGTSDTLTVNGIAGNRKFGGALESGITITEIEV